MTFRLPIRPPTTGNGNSGRRDRGPFGLFGRKPDAEPPDAPRPGRLRRRGRGSRRQLGHDVRPDPLPRQREPDSPRPPDFTDSCTTDEPPIADALLRDILLDDIPRVTGAVIRPDAPVPAHPRWPWKSWTPHRHSAARPRDRAPGQLHDGLRRGPQHRAGVGRGRDVGRRRRQPRCHQRSGRGRLPRRAAKSPRLRTQRRQAYGPWTSASSFRLRGARIERGPHPSTCSVWPVLGGRLCSVLSAKPADERSGTSDDQGCGNASQELGRCCHEEAHGQLLGPCTAWAWRRSSSAAIRRTLRLTRSPSVVGSGAPAC